VNTIASLQREKSESEEIAANEKKLLQIKNLEVCFDRYLLLGKIMVMYICSCIYL